MAMPNAHSAADALRIARMAIVEESIDRSAAVPNKVVSRFGIADPMREGTNIGFAFVVSSGRKDKRHGFVSQPVKPSKWYNELYKGMFGRWNDANSD